MVAKAVVNPINYATTFGYSGTYYDYVQEIATEYGSLNGLINLNITKDEVTDVLITAEFKDCRFAGALEWIIKNHWNCPGARITNQSTPILCTVLIQPSELITLLTYTDSRCPFSNLSHNHFPSKMQDYLRFDIGHKNTFCKTKAVLALTNAAFSL